MKTYRHDLGAYIVIPAIIGMIGYYAVEMCFFSGPIRGGELMRYLFIAFVALFSFGCTYLYIRYVLVKYYLTDDGLMVRRPWSTTVRAWSELQPPTVNRALKYLSVRDADGKRVIFTSIDFFSDIQEFHDQLVQRTQSNAPR